MVKHHLKRHKYKIMAGIPIAFLLASTLSFMRDAEEICIVPEDNRYVEVGETVTLHLIADTDEPVNVIGATVFAPKEFVLIEDVSREESIIDLWSEEPVIEDEGAKMHFSGGIVSDTGFIGNGTVLTLVLRPQKEGKATITIDEPHMLAHDGTGMEVGCGTTPITLSIRPASHPSPDVNGDKHVNIFDFGIVSARLFMSYNKAYDLNMDGKISLADIGVLLSNFTRKDQLASLALFWTK